MVKKPKIIFLLHLPPPVHGSSVMGLYVKESKLINQKFNCYYINLLASHNVAESGIVNFKKIFSFFITWFRLLFSILRNRPDLCYLAVTVTGAAFYRDLLFVITLKLFRIKIIYHLHNKGISLHQDKFLKRLSYRFVFQNTEVILISKLLYNDIKSFVPYSRVHICPNGINEKNNYPLSFKSDNHSLLDQEEKKPTKILFLSNLIESKGVYILLNACSILKKKDYLFNCVFIGGESDITISKFNDRIKLLGLGDTVSYEGAKYEDEKIKAFKESDIFVFPTYYYYETFGIVILEAMQHSKPVISTFEGGIPDIIDDGITGFMVPQMDVESLAYAMEILISNSDLRIKMGNAGRKKYEREFTLNIFENKLYNILQKIIDK